MLGTPHQEEPIAHVSHMFQFPVLPIYHFHFAQLLLAAVKCGAQLQPLLGTAGLHEPLRIKNTV